MSAKPQSIDRTLSLAKSHARRGDLTRAEELYRDILARFPQNRRAITGLRSLTGELLHQKPGAAPGSAATPVADPVGGTISAVRRGRRFLEDGRADRAERAFAEAIAIDGDRAEAHVGLSTALRKLGRNGEAVGSARRAIELAPGLADAHRTLGCALAELDQHPQALLAFVDAIRLDPRIVQSYLDAADTLILLGKYEEALSSLALARKIRPDAAHVHNQHGRALNRLGRHGEAMESLREALRLAPDASAVHTNMGVAQGSIGDHAAAVASFERAVELDGDNIHARFNLGFHTRARPGDPRIEQMRRLLARPGRSSEESQLLHFALGKACEEIGEREASFGHYLAGNRLRKQASGYRFDTDERMFARIRSGFPPEGVAEVVPEGMAGKRPIFIVGMPRSGTSLVEQILASHSGVHGAGELELLARATMPIVHAPEDIPPAGISAEQSREICAEYWKGVAALNIAAPVLVDKMPLNFRFVGFALAAMPEARVVHTERNPMATCWSIFKHRFNSRGNGFAYDLDDLGRYYRMYRELMGFWHARFPGRILDLNYERLTEHQEAETRRLLEFVDLPWEDACLDFHRTRRAVLTASADQVRRKMYRGSSDAWQGYAPWLGPLKDALGDLAGIAADGAD